MKTIERMDYLHQLLDFKDNSNIKIMTGMRGSGKSFVMKQYIEHLKQNDANINVIYIDFLASSSEYLSDFNALKAYIEHHFQPDMNNYLFMDHVQFYPCYYALISDIYAMNQYDIYVTWTHALNKKCISFPYNEVHIFPFSFKEFVQYNKGNTDLDQLFHDFIVKGGLSGCYGYRSDKYRLESIHAIYASILKDICKDDIKDVALLEQLNMFLMEHIGSIYSPNKISECLLEQGITTNHVTIKKYIHLLCSSFMYYDIKRYDIHNKKILSSLQKFYLCDISIPYSIMNEFHIEPRSIYENLIYIELLRRGYDVYIGKLYQKRIDFVAIKKDEKFYIQVCEDISNVEAFKAASLSLLQIKDNYPKRILSLTNREQYLYEGIEIIDIKDWLLT